MKYLLFGLVLAIGAVAAINPFTTDQRFQFEYRVKVPKFEGEKLSLWVPFPVENRYQKIVSHRVRSGQSFEMGKEKRFGNRMLYFEIERSAPQEIVIEYEIERKVSRGFASTELKGSLNPRLYAKHNQWISVNPTIKEMADHAVRGAKTESEKIRALYDYVVKIMRYNKDGKGWGKGDPIWACTSKRGNCTDFHSLYISMARYLGLSARFEIGVPIPMHMDQGKIPGYHCWANAYDSKRGWVPFDASEAKKSGKKEEYFGTLPSDRILFSVGRDLTLSPPQKAGKLNYFIYPYAEVDGKEFAKVEKEFRFKRI